MGGRAGGGARGGGGAAGGARGLTVDKTWHIKPAMKPGGRTMGYEISHQWVNDMGKQPKVETTTQWFSTKEAAVKYAKVAVGTKFTVEG